MKKRILSILLVLALCLTMLPTAVLAGGSSAATVSNVSYLDANGAAATCASAVKLTDSTVPTTWGEAGKTTWYTIDENVTISDTVVVEGDVRLILPDGKNLTVTKDKGQSTNSFYDYFNALAIGYRDSGSLTIYGQSGGTGELNVTTTGGNNNTAIEVCEWSSSPSRPGLTINGGKVTAIAGDANRYSWGLEACTDVIINGGKLTATGSKSTSTSTAGRSYGILIQGSTMTVNGGTVEATSDTCANGHSYGINVYSNSKLIVNGGTVKATSGEATNGRSVGIYVESNLSRSASCEMTVNGGEIEATGAQATSTSAGILVDSGCKLTVNAGKITANNTATSGAECYGIYVSGRRDGSVSYGRAQLHFTSGTIKANALSPIDLVGRTKPETLPDTYYWRRSESDNYTVSTTSDYSTSGDYLELTTRPISGGYLYYCDWDETTNKLVDKAFSTSDNPDWEVTAPSSEGNTRMLSAGFYALTSDVSFPEPSELQISGDVSLVLCDGAALNAYILDYKDSSSSLTIYGQAGQTGKLVVTYGFSNNPEGSLTIEGGTVELSQTDSSQKAVGGALTFKYGTLKAGSAGGVFISDPTLPTAIPYYWRKSNTGNYTISTNAPFTKAAGDTYAELTVHRPSNEQLGIVPYQAWDSANKKLVDAECYNPTQFTGSGNLTGGETAADAKWYYIKTMPGDIGDVSVAGSVSVTGHVNLILVDGAAPVIQGKLMFGENASLTIYGQSGQSGRLSVNNGITFNDNAALTINGGSVKASTGMSTTAAIDLANQSTLTVNAGNLTAEGQMKENDVGISIASGTMTVNGGTVTATGKSVGVYVDSTSGNSLTFNGGTLIAKRINETGFAVQLGAETSFTVPGSYFWRAGDAADTKYQLPDYTAAALAGTYFEITTVTPDATKVDYPAVSYLDADGKTEKTITAADYTAITASTTTLTGGTQAAPVWYVVQGNVTIGGTLQIDDAANINLILCNGATLTVTEGIINENEEGSLTIYGQKPETGKAPGKLIVTGAVVRESGSNAGISTAIAVDSLTVNGGQIEATGGDYSEDAFVTGSFGISTTTLTVNGGKLTGIGGKTHPQAVSDDCASVGIFVGGTATINGGEVIAKGGHAPTSIGFGVPLTLLNHAKPTLIMNGGKLTATGADAPTVTTTNRSEVPIVMSSGICVYMMSIDGGTVKGTGGKANMISSGIVSLYALAVNPKTNFIPAGKTLDNTPAGDTETGETETTTPAAPVVEGIGGAVLPTESSSLMLSLGIGSALVSVDGVNLMLSTNGIDLDPADTTADSTTTQPSATVTATAGDAGTNGMSIGLLPFLGLHVGVSAEDIMAAFDNTGESGYAVLGDTPTEEPSGATPATGSTANITATGTTYGILAVDMFAAYGLPVVWLNGGKLTARSAQNGILVTPMDGGIISLDTLGLDALGLNTLGLDTLGEEESGGEPATPVTTVYVQKGTLIADATAATSSESGADADADAGTGGPDPRGTTPSGLALVLGEWGSDTAPLKCPEAYWWRTVKTSEYTKFPTAKYTYTGTHNYVEITDTEPATQPGGGGSGGGSGSGGGDSGGGQGGGSGSGGGQGGGSGSGSSGSSVSQTYAINLLPTSGGVVSSSLRRSPSGLTITITVSPDKGSALTALTVTDATGKEITLTRQPDGSYTFTMPSSDVDVKTTFAKQTNSFVDVSPADYFYSPVLWAAASNITGGVDATHFAPDRTCTRAQLVTFLWRAAGCPVVNFAMNFTDVDTGAYYAEAVRWASSLNLVGGYGNGLFGTNDPITREQMAAILYRFAQAMGYDVSVGEDTNILSYTDALDISEYAIPAIQWAVGVGILQGANGALMPAQPCTRAQIVTMLYRLLGN